MTVLVLQQSRLRWYGHVLRKEDNDWLKKCMEYEVEAARPRGRPKITWREIVEKDCQARELNREDAMDHNRWRKQTRDDWWPWYVWVGECFVYYRLTRVVPDKIPSAIKWLCVYVCLSVTKYLLKLHLQLTECCWLLMLMYCLETTALSFHHVQKKFMLYSGVLWTSTMCRSP